MDIPEPVNLSTNQYRNLEDQQIINKFDNLREWVHFGDNSKDLMEEVSRRLTLSTNVYVPQLHTVFPDRREHPKLTVVFTEFRSAELCPVLDVYCRIDTATGPAEYRMQTFDREFKPVNERMTEINRDVIVRLMEDRITKV